MSHNLWLISIIFNYLIAMNRSVDKSDKFAAEAVFDKMKKNPEELTQRILWESRDNSRSHSDVGFGLFN